MITSLTPWYRLVGILCQCWLVLLLPRDATRTIPKQSTPTFMVALPFLAKPACRPYSTQGVTAFSFLSVAEGWIAVDTEVWRTDNAGTQWDRRGSLVDTIQELDVVSATDGWALTVCDQLFHTQDGDLSWTSTLPVPLHDIDFVSPTTGWIQPTDPQALWRTTDGGHTWEPLLHPCATWDGGRYFSFVSETTGWALCLTEPGTGFQGKSVWHTHDGGTTWIQIAKSTYLDEVTTYGLRPWEYGRGIFFVDHQYGWIATGRGRDGTEYRSSNGGRMWSAIDREQEGAPSVFQFLDPQQGYTLSNLYIDNTVALLYTRDGGESWEPVQTPSGHDVMENERNARLMDAH